MHTHKNTQFKPRSCTHVNIQPIYAYTNPTTSYSYPNTYRLGIEGRDKVGREQREKQIMLNKLAKEESAAKLVEAENKMTMAIDFDFSEVDIARSDTKLLSACM